jgi:Protein of unknown function (DUF3052)
MAGYSKTPLYRKLGIKPGHTIALVGSPSGWEIEGLPEAVTVRAQTDGALRMQAGGALDLIVAFFRERADIERDLSALMGALDPDGSLWIAWPRKAAGHVSDISENDLRDIVLPTGMVDTKVAALDEDWSGLKFVWRRELRSQLPTAAR